MLGRKILAHHKCSINVFFLVKELFQDKELIFDKSPLILDKSPNSKVFAVPDP